MKKVLITGANGFLGQHLCYYLHANGYKITATGKGQSRIENNLIEYRSTELTSGKEVNELINEVKPDVIIHNAAMSKPDECEANKKLCIDVNVNTTKYLLQSPQCHFIYLSTDFVFGENGPHSEEDPTGPLNFYGESKLQSEQLVVKSAHNATIVRPVFIYGPVFKNVRPSFLHWVKNNLEQNKQIKVVSDQWRTPTFAPDICSGIHTIIQKQASGKFHLAGKDILSPYDMALSTARFLNLNEKLIENVTASTFPEPVKRAKKSGLLIDKAIAILNYNPVSFTEGIYRTFTDKAMD